MARDTRKKKDEVVVDDSIRRLVTVLYEAAADEAGIETSSKDRAAIVDAIVDRVGGPIQDTIQGVCDLLFDLGETEEEDDDDDEEEEDSRPRRRGSSR